MSDPEALNSGRLNFYNANLLPPLVVGTWRRWLLRVILWLGVAAAFGLALRYDVLLMQWRYEALPEGPQGILKQIFYGFRDFAQVLPIFVTMLIIARMDKRRLTIIVTLLMAQILAGIGYNTSKLTIARYRPYAAFEQVAPLDELQFDQTWGEFAPSLRGNAMQSFPSGHSAGAFALAGVLAWFYPPLAGIFWFLAVGCAFSRYVDAVHWMSDCVAGAAIGYAGAWLALRPYTWAVPFWIIRRWKGKPASTG
jgi:membrane-associated phospholipid phosphatase